eukprot:jgi/Mesvir1/5579/Mv15598-RA.1
MAGGAANEEVDEGGGGNEMTEEEEMQALESAMKLNQELKRMAAMSVGTKNGAGGPSKTKKLTFTKPPDTTQAQKFVPADYTFSNNEIRKINVENTVLANKLAHVEARTKVTTTKPESLKVASTAPSAVNRKKKESEIERQNAALYNRLVNVKPTMKLTPPATIAKKVGTKPAPAKK